jgi:hypothetical protein
MCQLSKSGVILELSLVHNSLEVCQLSNQGNYGELRTSGQRRYYENNSTLDSPLNRRSASLKERNKEISPAQSPQGSLQGKDYHKIFLGTRSIAARLAAGR